MNRRISGVYLLRKAVTQTSRYTTRIMHFYVWRKTEWQGKTIPQALRDILIRAGPWQVSFSSFWLLLLGFFAFVESKEKHCSC